MGGVMVRAVVLSSFDGLGGVDVREVDEPVVADDGVLIRVVYAALGPWDVATTHGAFAGAGGGTGLPQVLGWDFAGIVEASAVRCPGSPRRSGCWGSPRSRGQGSGRSPS